MSSRRMPAHRSQFAGRALAARAHARIPEGLALVKSYRPRNDGIREWDPRTRRAGPVALTERSSPSIRTVRGWLMPLEHYDENLKLNVLEQYTELLLVMGSGKAVDFESVAAVMREARNRLSDEEYGRLLDYKSLIESARTGIGAEVLP